jgi:hypothetical protein
MLKTGVLCTGRAVANRVRASRRKRQAQRIVELARVLRTYFLRLDVTSVELRREVVRCTRSSILRGTMQPCESCLCRLGSREGLARTCSRKHVPVKSVVLVGSARLKARARHSASSVLLLVTETPSHRASHPVMSIPETPSFPYACITLHARHQTRSVSNLGSGTWDRHRAGCAYG